MEDTSMDTSTLLIPDASGTVYIKGEEKLAHEYNMKYQMAELAKEEVESLKERLRKLAFNAAVSAGAGVRRIMLLGIRGTAVNIQVTDPAQEGNRLEIKSKTIEELTKLGGVGQLGQPEELFERTKVLPARVVLTGQWYDWFMRDVFNAGRVAETFIGAGKGVELLDADPGQLKLSASGITKLRDSMGKLTGAAKAACVLLLESGVKALSVKADLGEK